jgi:hypothetical protein
VVGAIPSVAAGMVAVAAIAAKNGRQPAWMGTAEAGISPIPKLAVMALNPPEIDSFYH